MDVVPTAIAVREVGGSTSRGALDSTLGLAAVLSLTLFLSAGLAGCRQQSPSLEHTLESPEAVARAVFDAFNTGDRPALQRLALTEHEFRKYVWPKLPASRPGRNIPWDYVWKELHGKSEMQMQARLHEWQRETGGSVVRVEFTGETTDYDTYRVRRDSIVVLKTAAGEERRQRLFGSIIEQGGRYKVFSYVVD